MEPQGSLQCSQQPILSQIHPLHAFPPSFPTIHSNIILPSTPMSSECSLPFRFPNQSLKYIEILSNRNIMTVRWRRLMGIFAIPTLYHTSLGCWLDDRCSGVRFPTEAGGIFLFTTASRMAPGPTQPPIQSVPGALSLRVKRPGREVDHSPPSSDKVKNAWSYTSTSPISLHCVVLT